MGIHPEFSSFDRRSADLEGARRTMWLWAEPIIIDRAVELYSSRIGEAATLTMARRHCRLWRTVLSGQSSSSAPILSELRRAVGGLGLSEDIIDEINDVILEELVDIVMSRYRASRNALKAFSMLLMSATSCLGTVRHAA